MSKGYEKLKESVMRDCEGDCNCFNEDGCNSECKRCFHAYCDKFKWIIDRAKEYSKVTGLDWNDILDAWEENRNYWYMNYYQDCNQPHLDEGEVYVFESSDEATKSFQNLGFRCPACGGISSNPYECDSGIKDENGKKCDWKSYGLLGCMGKGVFIFLKDKMLGQTIFMPIAWEKKEEEVL